MSFQNIHNQPTIIMHLIVDDVLRSLFIDFNEQVKRHRKVRAKGTIKFRTHGIKIIENDFDFVYAFCKLIE